MTRDEATRLIQSSSPHDRIKAARFLAGEVQLGDLKFFQDVRARETVGYVKSVLDLAISRARDLAATETPAPTDAAGLTAELKQAVRSRAVKFIAGQLLHELSGPIGLLALAASQEVPDYPQSRTRKRMDALQRIFEAVEFLQTAATEPKPAQFDLSEVITEVASAERGKDGIEISFEGPKPLLVNTDKRLFEMALCNGVRNALEAVAGMEGHATTHPIIVTWGETDVDYWVSVLDAGPGLPQGSANCFDFGNTGKSGHAGFGLAIARQAMQSIGGTCELSPGAKGGARFDLRWGR